MVEIICALIASLSTIIVAILSLYIKRIMGKMDRRQSLRERESLLNLRLTSAAVKLSIVNANAVMNYANNGNVEEAYTLAKDAEDEYERFQQEVTAHEVGK